MNRYGSPAKTSNGLYPELVTGAEALSYPASDKNYLKLMYGDPDSTLTAISWDEAADGAICQWLLAKGTI